MQRTNYEESKAPKKTKKVEKQKEEIIDEVVSKMDEEVEDKLEPQKETKEETEKKKKGIKYLSGEWIKKPRGWKREGETDEDGYPIMRRENPSATMFHIEREGRVRKEGTGKDEKQYPVRDITFKRTGENILAYKKDGQLVQVRRTKVPFNLAKRLYETGHVYESKAQKDSE